MPCGPWGLSPPRNRTAHTRISQGVESSCSGIVSSTPAWVGQLLPAPKLFCCSSQRSPQMEAPRSPPTVLGTGARGKFFSGSDSCFLCHFYPPFSLLLNNIRTRQAVRDIYENSFQVFFILLSRKIDFPENQNLNSI